MPQRVSIEALPQVRDAVFDLVSTYAKSKRFCRYADVRIEVSEGKVRGGRERHGQVQRRGLRLRLRRARPGRREDRRARLLRRARGRRRPAAPAASACGRRSTTPTTAPSPTPAARRARAAASARWAAACTTSTLAPIDVRQDTIDATVRDRPARGAAGGRRPLRAGRLAARGRPRQGRRLQLHLGATRCSSASSSSAPRARTSSRRWAITQGTCFVVAPGRRTATRSCTTSPATSAAGR